MTISQRIFELLKKKHITQKQLADFTGISTAAISSWKRFGTNPTSDKIPKICEFLDVSYEYLLTGNVELKTTDQMIHDIVTGDYDISEVELELLAKYRMLSDIDKGRILGIIESKLSDLNITD